MMKKNTGITLIIIASMTLIGLSGCTTKVDVQSSTNVETVIKESPSLPIPTTEHTELAAEPIRIYLVRHGQTYSNIKEATIGGGGNAQLTEKGRQYAYSLGLGFQAEDIVFSAAYSSTLERAHETAQQILRGNHQDLAITQSDQLKDISWGSVEGGRIADLEIIYGVDGNDFGSYFGTFDQPDFKPLVEGSESTYHYANRIDAALREIVAEHQQSGGNILVVGHSSLGFYLHKYRADQDMTGLTNTSTSILEYKDGEFTLLEYDLVNYLEHGLDLNSKLKPLQLKLITTPQTIFKTAGVIEGTSDSDLNEAGIRQAQLLKEMLDKEEIGSVYCSNLNRSRKTAAIVLDEKAIEQTEDTYLNELFLGYWEAEKLSTLQENDQENLSKLLSATEILQFTSPDGGGENPVIAAYRLKTALNRIGSAHQSDENTAIVFTHPYILKTYLTSEFPDQPIEISDQMQIVTLEYNSEHFTIVGTETVNSQ